MDDTNHSFTHSVYCELCKKNIPFTVDLQELADLRENEVFTFTLMHADDHTLEISLDEAGTIKHTCITKLPEKQKKMGSETNGA